ncbi:hypothetical protein F4804DRAFT_349241 [Jackrogersella minutella]|nr:hypothetical protein F4804DRAFT_349241 [Jackrogersella minutella]
MSRSPPEHSEDEYVERLALSPSDTSTEGDNHYDSPTDKPKKKDPSKFLQPVTDNQNNVTVVSPSQPQQHQPAKSGESDKNEDNADNGQPRKGKAPKTLPTYQLPRKGVFVVGRKNAEKKEKKQQPESDIEELYDKVVEKTLRYGGNAFDDIKPPSGIGLEKLEKKHADLVNSSNLSGFNEQSTSLDQSCSSRGPPPPYSGSPPKPSQQSQVVEGNRSKKPAISCKNGQVLEKLQASKQSQLAQPKQPQWKIKQSMKKHKKPLAKPMTDILPPYEETVRCTPEHLCPDCMTRWKAPSSTLTDEEDTLSVAAAEKGPEPSQTAAERDKQKDDTQNSEPTIDLEAPTRNVSLKGNTHVKAPMAEMTLEESNQTTQDDTPKTDDAEPGPSTKPHLPSTKELFDSENDSLKGL